MGSLGSAAAAGASFDQQIIDLQENLSLSQKLVAQAREKYLDSMKSTYDRNAKLQIFNVGDKCLYMRQHFDLHKPVKLMSRYTGPYEIVEKNASFNTYRLKDLKTNKIHPNFTHVCKLKPYRERVNEEIAVRTSDETSGADEVHPGTTPDPNASNNYTPMPNSNNSGDSDNLGSRQNQQPAAHEIVENPAHPTTSGHKSPPE